MVAISGQNRFGQLGPENLPKPIIDPQTHEQSASPLSWKFGSDYRLEALRNAPVILDLAQIKGVVFDNDGLLVNSERAILSCIFRATEEMIRLDKGIDTFQFSVAEVAQIKRNCFGKSEKDMGFSLHATIHAMGHTGPRLSSISSQQFFDELISNRIEMYTAALRNGEVTVTSGVFDLLNALHQSGTVVALCTGNAEPFIRPQFEILFRDAGLPNIDQIIPPELRIYGNELPKGFGKPHPFSYERAARRIATYCPEITPKQLAFSEDRLSGVMSALTAGYRLGIVVAENGDFAAIENPSEDHSVARLMSFYEDHEQDDRNPSRVIVTGGLDRVVLKKTDGSYWLPPYYRNMQSEMLDQLLEYTA